jgi:hypothetical protein
MALRFDDTELLPQPLKWQEFQNILASNGQRTNVQSPVEIHEPTFAEIYRRGFRIE